MKTEWKYRYYIYQVLNSFRYYSGVPHDTLDAARKPDVMIRADSPEDAWYKLNHWHDRSKPDIMPMIHSGKVGDIFHEVETGKTFVCESAGFSEYSGSRDFSKRFPL